MQSDCREFIERIRYIADPDTLWRTVLSFFRQRGAQRVSYRHFLADYESEDRPTIFHDGFPERFVRKFESEELFRNNPIAEIALATTEPFYWSDVSRVANLSDEERRFLKIVREEISGDGVVLQLFGPGGRNGTVNLGFVPDTPRLSPTALRELQLVAQAAHLAYCRMVTVQEEDTSFGMTDRELEVLAWIARGKSNSVIADILGISAHTVDTHVRRIFRKLGVNDRTTAAVKGFGLGLLEAA
ncbi:helix-turn-helix transcriptional regulator [Tropicimonas marinistellae]|uniref:helix-turn-helix transcriptional regulator n=1 Tax=Tropicimonas marinistellae TaxID=1739787 RepID=UPI00082DAEDF|nr:LuxR family transcriptional regulator [Tropicimonas marinistellae]